MSTLSPTKFSEMNAADLTKLKSITKDTLISYISTLREKVDELESYSLVAKRVELLERTTLNSLQYQRRESIEIHNIPESVADDKLEKYCIDLLDDIGCGPVKESKIHACHRLKNRKKTVIRFANRKFADKSLRFRKQLKVIDKVKYEIPNGSPGIFINESLCRPMQFLFFKVRQASKLMGRNGLSYNLWKGKLTIKLNEKDYAISHINDLIVLGLAEEDDRLLFFK